MTHMKISMAQALNQALRDAMRPTTLGADVR